MRTTISPDLWIVYIPMNRSTCILTLQELGKTFHLLQNAPTPALIYHDFLPTSTHAHNYITRSLDSLHPNEQVYIHFNIKRVEKVVLRRKKAKVGKTHCFTCFKMRLRRRVEKVVLRRKKGEKAHCFTKMRADLAKWAKGSVQKLFHLLQNTPTPALIYHDFLPTSTHADNYITTISPDSLDSLTSQCRQSDLWILYFPMNRSTCILTLQESKKSC